MDNNWYKFANEFVNVDGTMTPGDIADTRNFKANGLSPETDQLLPKTIIDTRNHPIQEKKWIRVTTCGEEPNARGCGLNLEKAGVTWKDYPIKIDGESYEAYQCHNCKHELKPFDIQYTKNPKRKHNKRRRKKVTRLSSRVTKTSFVKEAATPALPTPGGYNNIANQPFGRLDLSEDVRVVPWTTMQDMVDREYSGAFQKNNKDFKIIRVKDKNGKVKYIKVKKPETGGDSVSPANVYYDKGRRKKQPRYNPKKNVQNQNPGAWPHNRDDNEGAYNMYIDKNRMNSDMRERAVPWHQYRQDNLSLLKPY